MKTLLLLIACLISVSAWGQQVNPSNELIDHNVIGIEITKNQAEELWEKSNIGSIKRILNWKIKHLTDNSITFKKGSNYYHIFQSNTLNDIQNKYKIYRFVDLILTAPLDFFGGYIFLASGGTIGSIFIPISVATLFIPHISRLIKRKKIRGYIKNNQLYKDEFQLETTNGKELVAKGSKTTWTAIGIISALLLISNN